METQTKIIEMYETATGAFTPNKPREQLPPPAPKKPRKTYGQDWANYNAAQTSEKFLALQIIHSVVDALAIEEARTHIGRPRLDMRDMIKCCFIKVFTKYSYRRTMSDVKIARLADYVHADPHFDSLNKYMGKSSMTKYLHKLIEMTATPLAPFETDFATDATGIGTAAKKKWIQVRLEKREHKDYKKLHIITGVKTNIVTTALVTEGTDHESPHFPYLLKETLRNFKPQRVSADAGYLSRENAQVIEDAGAKPFIMPKSNTTLQSKGYPAWHRMILLWQQNEKGFRDYYHRRSNVESTFHAIKMKFGGYTRSKTDIATTNEILLKVLCHNVSVLVESIYTLKIDPTWE